MAIDTITPVGGSIVAPGDTLYFTVDDTYTTMVIEVETSTGWEYAYDGSLSGTQVGYTVSVVSASGRHTFAVKRNAGFDLTPFDFKVTENETGSNTTTTTAYLLSGQQLFPQGTEPYDSIFNPDNVTGPASAVNENIAVFDGVSGNVIKDGGITIAALQASVSASAQIITGSGAPGVSTGDGYPVGTIYVDTTGDRAYVLADATLGANVWSSSYPSVDEAKLAGIEAGAVADGTAGDAHATITSGNPHNVVHDELAGLGDDDHTQYAAFAQDQSSPPTANSDNTAGYRVGSFWMTTSATEQRLYICTDATTGAAKWTRIILMDSATSTQAGNQFTGDGITAMTSLDGTEVLLADSTTAGEGPKQYSLPKMFYSDGWTGLYGGVGTSPADYNFQTDSTDPSLVTTIYLKEQGYGPGTYAGMFASSQTVLLAETGNWGGFLTPYGLYTIDSTASAGGVTTLNVTPVSSYGTLVSTRLFTAVLFGGGGGGSGDVVGPASSTDLAIARFDSTTGKLLKDSPNSTIGANGELALGGSNAGVKLTERASAPSTAAGYGYIWVKNSAPSDLRFTDDTGVDHVLNRAIMTQNGQGSTAGSTNWYGPSLYLPHNDTHNGNYGVATGDAYIDASVIQQTVPFSGTITDCNVCWRTNGAGVATLHLWKFTPVHDSSANVTGVDLGTIATIPGTQNVANRYCTTTTLSGASVARGDMVVALWKVTSTASATIYYTASWVCKP